CVVVALTGVDADNRGATLHVVAPFDRVQRLERRTRPVRVRATVWRRACRELLASAAPPGGLATAAGARIDVMPHQLEPALAVVRGRGSRLLLADEVGLGKTIQAALIVSELRARGAADRVLILTPPGLREQWVRELSHRHAIECVVADVAGLRRLAADL